MWEKFSHNCFQKLWIKKIDTYTEFIIQNKQLDKVVLWNRKFGANETVFFARNVTQAWFARNIK